jgi:hypothetical protein
MAQEEVVDCGAADKAFLRAMVDLAQWRKGHPGSEADDEPDDIAAKRKAVMLRLSELREGEMDPWMGREIKVLVRKSTRYVVYLDQDLDIQWWWAQRFPKEEDLSVIQANVTRLSGASAFLLDDKSDLRLGGIRRTWMWGLLRQLFLAGQSDNKSILQQENERARRTAEQIRLLIAESMAMLLNGAGRAECEKVQAMAEQQILVAKDQLCRSIFFWQFVWALLVLLGLTVLTQKFGGLIWSVNDAPSILWYFAAMSGAFGAFLSAISRTRSLMLEPDSGLRGLRMEAFARALIGAGAGILVYFAFESGLIVKAAIDKSNQDAMKMFLCIASGWSERILPALMARAETMVVGTQASTKDDKSQATKD